MVAEAMVEIWRGGTLENLHMGHAVVFDANGGIVDAWGNPDAVIFPRSSCKMIQALPLLESGAADAAGLTEAQLALSCASHRGAAIHTDMVTGWLAALGLGEADLRCGPQMPDDPDAFRGLLCSDLSPCQIHNNCSGKHSGFLTLARHLKAGPEYVDPDHPVQRAVRAAFEEVTGMASPGYGIDGCSAPNFTTTVTGLARAMAFFAAANPAGSLRERAAARLVRAMMARPELVDGEGGSCTGLMRAMGGKVAAKSGADGVYVAILPERGLGIALKIADGNGPARDAAMTAILVRLGVLDASHPIAVQTLSGPMRNRRGMEVGAIRLSVGFC